MPIQFTRAPQQRHIYRDRTGRTWLGPWIDPGRISTRRRQPRPGSVTPAPPFFPAPPGVNLPTFEGTPQPANCCPDQAPDQGMVEFRFPEVPPGCTGGLAELSPNPDADFGEWCE